MSYLAMKNEQGEIIRSIVKYSITMRNNIADIYSPPQT